MTTVANVYVTRLLPEPALQVLRDAGLSFRAWPEEGRPVPRGWNMTCQPSGPGREAAGD